MGLRSLLRFTGLFRLAVVLSLSLFSLASYAEEEAESKSEYPTDAASVEEGYSLFEGNCAACHAMEKVITGPALKDITKIRKKEWLLAWIKDPKGMIDSGDPIAKKLADEYKPVIMNSFGSLSNKQIESILGYIETYVPPTPTTPNDSGDGTVTVAQEDNSTVINIVLGVFILVLLLMILCLVILINFITKLLKNRDGLSEEDLEVVNQSYGLKQVLTHPAFLGILISIGILAGLHSFVHDGLYGVGVQLGYAPTQPIAFSHKIHAGEREIDCNYCHTGVRKAKHANIPSANICMNCHNSVKTESKEIQKIYAALDYNPKTKEYGENVRPIEWKRIHNLPDLVYFNHAQHVQVGGIECETCHGPVAEMEVVRQYSSLTMGWCIDCHRKTAVDASNPYYDKLLEKHEAGELTVEDIGGTDCSKCHY